MKIKLTKEFLEQKYWHEGKSLPDIAKETGWSAVTIRNQMLKFEIPTRTVSEAPRKAKKFDIPLKEELEDFYWNQQKSIQQVANHYEVSTMLIHKWFKHHNIQKRNLLAAAIIKRPKLLTKEELNHYYLNCHYTTYKIADLYNVSDVSVGRWLKKANIEIRDNERTSQAERDISEFLSFYGIETKRDRIILNGCEIDIYSEIYKIGIEYCGLYWHNDEFVSKQSHINKHRECQQKGIQLITIFEDEWLYHQEVTKAVLLSKFGINPRRFYARQCKIDLISKEDASDFCEKYHLQGKSRSTIFSFGLYYENELLGVLTYGRHHRISSRIVLNRLCFKRGVQIVGGSSKLFKYSLQFINQKEIETWSDNRWSNGKVYKEMGFTIIKELSEDYSYTKGNMRFSKQSMKKSIVGCPKHIKEIEWNKSRGYRVIWDCGKIRWKYSKC